MAGPDKKVPGAVQRRGDVQGRDIEINRPGQENQSYHSLLDFSERINASEIVGSVAKLVNKKSIHLTSKYSTVLADSEDENWPHAIKSSPAYL